MMKARTSLWASLAIAASLGLAGCGGSSDNDGDGGTPPATPSGPTTHDPITVPAAADLRVNADGSGTSNIKAGESRKAPGGGTLACATADCALAIVRDAGDGSFTVTSTGGTVTYTPPAEPEVSGAGAVALRGQLLDAADAGDESPSNDSGFTDVMPLAAAGFPGTGELSNPKDFTSADAPVALQGWKGERWTKDGEVIVRYTDQNVKTMTDGTFASRFGDADGGSGAEIANIQTFVDAEDGIAAVGDAWKHAESDDFPAANREQEYAHVIDADDVSKRVPVSLTGKYAGVEGKFTCGGGGTATECSLKRDSKGNLSIVGEGTWSFTADNENAAVEYKVQDSDYLAFGWWRDSSTGGTTIEDFKVLYSGRTAPYGTPSDVAGKATYNGHAAGNYVKGTEGGEFVADAKLEATFGDAGADEIKGTISNFRDSSDESLGKWEVIAKAATTGEDIADAGTFDIDAVPTGGADGENWAGGQMAGTFYGEDVNGGDANEVQPTGVAGWFHATTSTSSTWTDDDVVVAGAFAATRHNRPDVAAE